MTVDRLQHSAENVGVVEHIVVRDEEVRRPTCFPSMLVAQRPAVSGPVHQPFAALRTYPEPERGLMDGGTSAQHRKQRTELSSEGLPLLQRDMDTTDMRTGMLQQRHQRDRRLMRLAVHVDGHIDLRHGRKLRAALGNDGQRCDRGSDR